MTHKKFTSRSGWFDLTLPVEWEEYDDDGAEDTYSFFNAINWTGNFRITPFQWEYPANPSEDKAGEFIAEELTDNEGAIKIRLGDLDCAHYKKATVQDGKDLLMYYWVVGKKDILFICSFTIDKKQEQSAHHNAELIIVEDILKSIRIN